MPSFLGGIQMKKLVCTFTILAAAAISTAAVAKDLKQDQKSTAPGVSAAQMSDSEMDRVIGGFGYGLTTAGTGGRGTALPPTTCVDSSPPASCLLDPGNAVFHPGYGNSTAISTGHHPFH